jgi:hypothetical protein
MSSPRNPPLIPLFDQNTDHSFAPANDRGAIACSGREHDGRLSIPQDGEVHRCDPGSIDAVGGQRTPSRGRRLRAGRTV